MLLTLKIYNMVEIANYRMNLRYVDFAWEAESITNYELTQNMYQTLLVVSRNS